MQAPHPALRRSLQVFLDVKVGKEEPGRIVFKLYGDVPKTVSEPPFRCRAWLLAHVTGATHRLRTSAHCARARRAWARVASLCTLRTAPSTA